MSDLNPAGPKLHRSAARHGSVDSHQTGLSRLEYAIIMLIVATTAVGVWKTFGESSELGLGGAATPAAPFNR